MSASRAADAFRSAFRVAPEVAAEVDAAGGVRIFGWKTPEFDGFALPESDELVLALHVGGSRRVRQVTDAGLSSTRSTPGLVTLLPPGRPAAFRTEGGVEVVTLHLARSSTGPLARLAEADTSRFAVRDTYVSAAMTALARAARSGTASPGYMLKVADALLAHLEQWAEAGMPMSTSGIVDADRMVGRVPLPHLLDHIDARLHQKLSLEELGRYCGLSRAQFSVAFRLATGCSPHQHVMQRRLHVARKMLMHTEHDLAFIAQETGFSSQSHFTRTFRAETGRTPARFRQGR
ncbi:MAG TPA: AraC family transcriptional regulator [Nevskiaceae bacterium]|nr:AraC family transcriptional regulator [Nevskiaceae bacterium]